MRLCQLSIAILVTGALSSLPSCWSESDSDSVSRKDCERLREHLIDVRMQSVTSDHAQHRIAIASSLDESFLSSCVDGMTSSYAWSEVSGGRSDGSTGSGMVSSSA